MKIDKTRKLLSCIRCSIKRWDLFSDIKVENGARCKFPSLDVERRWSSTFEMVQSGYYACRELYAVAAREEDLVEHMVSESEWKAR